MYTVYDQYSNRTDRKFQDWWSLIGFLKDRLDTIAHNPNDVMAYYDCGTFHLKPMDTVEEAIKLLSGIEKEDIIRTRWVYCRYNIIYDEYNRIINLNEIKEASLIYKEHQSKVKTYHGVFEYRKDPVPHTGKFWSKKITYSYYRKAHTNKKYLLDLKSWGISDSRLNSSFIKNFWWDESLERNNDKCWKNQRKRKQWMKK